MSNAVPPCRTITVFAFRGDRSRLFTTTFRKALNDEKNGRGPAPTALECLLSDHGATITFHRGVVAGDELRGYHALELIPMSYADQRVHCRVALPPHFFCVCIFEKPECVYCLIGQNVIPIVGH